MKKIIPWIPIIGIPFVLINRREYDSYPEIICIITGIIQALSVATIFGYIMAKMLI